MEIDILRMIYAFLGGYFLTLSGSLTQIVTVNHLASPSTLGFDALAALAVIIGQYCIVVFGLSHDLEVISFTSFLLLFSLVVAYLTFVLRGRRISRFQLDMDAIILIGLGFNLFVGAIFAVIQFLFMTSSWEFPTGLWFGNFRFYRLSYIGIFSLAFILTQIFLIKNVSQLRLLSLGEKVAFGLKVNVAKVQVLSLTLSLFLTGLVISFFGVFSFIGLIIPHMLRGMNFFKKNMRHELIYGPIAGGIGLALIDYACFSLSFRGAEFPAGMISSVLGSFLLIVLLFKSRMKNFAKG